MGAAAVRGAILGAGLGFIAAGAAGCALDAPAPYATGSGGSSTATHASTTTDASTAMSSGGGPSCVDMASSSVEMDCPAGAASCRLNCSGGSCKLHCNDATSCFLYCGGGSCDIDCGQATTCEVDCGGAACAATKTAANTSCSVVCGGSCVGSPGCTVHASAMKKALHCEDCNQMSCP